jgi:hypothetical protein
MLLYAPICIVFLFYLSPAAGVFPALILIPLMIYCTKAVPKAEAFEQLSEAAPVLSPITLGSPVPHA